MAEHIRQANLLEQHNQDYTAYAVEVIRHRVLPNPIDGLKAVHRRILYAMFHDIGIRTPTANTVKTARVIGDVIGKYHPHGDASVNDSIKPMINPFEIYMPLLRGQGSFGSLYGDPASAPRYTEVGLSEYALECIISELRDVSTATDWEPNFDLSMQEPEYFPAKVPNLIINGSSGIAVGMATSIPKHNISEVLKETIAVIDDPNHEVFLVPDNCTGCDIIATDFRSICRTGTGKVRMRGILEVVEFPYKKNSTYPALKVISMPDLVYFQTIKSQIETLIEAKKLPMVLDVLNNTTIDDKTEAEVFEAYIILNKECDPYYVREVIYKATSMESTVSVNMEVVVNGHPVLMSYTDYIKFFLKIREETKFRLYNNKYQQKITEHYRMQLYIDAMESGKIKEIQARIHKNKTRDSQPIIDWLIKEMKITPIQAKWLLDLDQSKTSVGWLNYYKEQRDVLLKEAEQYKYMATHPEAIMAEIRQELVDIEKKYGQPRRSRIITPEEASAIPAGMFRVIISKQNCIKKIGETERIGSLGGDEPRYQIPIDNRDELILFTTSGRVFSFPVHKIPFSQRGSAGPEIRSLLTSLTSDIACVIPKSRLEAMVADQCKFYCYSISKEGCIKRMDIEDFITVPSRGIIYSLLNDYDEIQSVLFMPEQFELLVYSHNKVIRIPGSEVPYLRRATKGYTAMRTRYPIDGFECLYPEATDLVVFTDHGKVNRVNIIGVPLSKRGQAGNSIIKLSKNDFIKAIVPVSENSVIRVYDKTEKVFDLIVNEIPVGSTVSPGDKLFPNGVGEVVSL